MDIILLDYKVAQVKVIFRTPPQLQALIFTEDKMPEYLAYVEWFNITQQQARHDEYHTLYRLKRDLQNGDRLAQIVPLANIRRSIQLMPHFGKKKPEDWNSSNVLDKCSSFYLNRYSDRHAFYTIM